MSRNSLQIENALCGLNESSETSLSRIRWLAWVLTGDEGLTNSILLAAQEQTGLGREPERHELLATWAQRLVIKDCVAALRPWTSTSEHRACFPGRALTHEDRELLTRVVESPSNLLRLRLQELCVLARFSFVLRAMEGFSRTQTALVLNVSEEECDRAYLRARLTLIQSWSQND
jgi:DNA-directed RNA polymerase specialized sigma24 family protein